MKESYAKREVLLRPDTKIMDREPQRPRLTFVLLTAGTHANVYKKFPTEVSLKEQGFKNKPMPRKVSRNELEPV